MTELYLYYYLSMLYNMLKIFITVFRYFLIILKYLEIFIKITVFKFFLLKSQHLGIFLIKLQYLEILPFDHSIWGLCL